jgi:ABC-type branched-subunit amino acid transport system ATPase component/ABC-type branched-subunit amino acid transport system permease subunit
VIADPPRPDLATRVQRLRDVNAVGRFGPAAIGLGVVLFAATVWSVPSGVLVQGAIIGALTSFLALGLALVWRANRIINFAAGDLGAVPATLAVLLTISTVALNWWLALVAGLAAALLVGAAVEFLLVRRFSRSPRLVLSVATIGIAQVLAAASLLLPRGFTVTGNAIPAPFDVHFTIDPIVFRGTDVVAVAAVPIVLVGLAWFLRRSDTGIAIRAGAERADRAASLGIPIRRLQTVVWVLATVLAFLAVFLRAGIVGLPIGQVLGPAILLRALAAAVIGRMERLPTIVGAAVVLGIVEQSVIWHWHEPAYVDPVLFVVVVVGLLATGGVRASRIREDEVSTWQAAREVRPVPQALRRLPEVRVTQVVTGLVVLAVLVGVPVWLSASKLNLAAAILIFGIIGCSLVVLTGWAGQVSLGQVAFVGIGAAVSGAVTARLGWDLSFGLLLAGASGAVVAVVIGLPALRRRGLTLAVTSLAFALMTSEWLLNRNFFGEGATLNWLPPLRITRPPLFGVIAVDTDTRFYYLCLAGLALAVALAYGVRASRTGRALIAVRENERAAEAFGIPARRLTLFAFAFSGFLAAFAGGLFVYQQSGLDPSPYLPTASLQVFAMAVIGGLGSIPGALIGATYVQGIDYFLAPEWQILATGAGLLAILLVLPGGLGAALADARDAGLRWRARRRGITVASLVGEELAAVADIGPPPAHTRAPRLLVRGMDVHYDSVQVVFGARLEAAPAEIVALLGTNGAGKSTVLRTIAGIHRCTTGSVLLDGEDVTRWRAEQIAARGVALVPGGAATFPSLTVAEHVRLAAWTQRSHPEQVRAATERALGHFPVLRDRLGHPAGTLSGGEQQMLALAMALIAAPKLLLIDELSLGLAPTVIASLLDVVRELAATGTSVVIVEQSADLALSLADHASFIEKGHIRFEGPAAELRDRHDLLRSVFLGGVAAGDLAPQPVGVPEPTTRRGAGLEVRGVAKRFGGVVALHHVALTVAPGEIVGILGPNGAGKTTLFDVISGFERPDAGTVTLVARDGRRVDLSRRAPSARAHQGLGRSFQDARLFPALTVSEAIGVALEDWIEVRDPVAAALHLPAVAASEAEARLRVDELIELFGLGAYAEKFVHELSTGTRRVVDLAGIVGQRPDVVLLDEPSSGIAQHEVEALGPLLQRVRDELGASLVVIEHDLSLLRAVAPRWVAMDLGTIVASGASETVAHDPRVVASYLGRDRPRGEPPTV